MHSRLLVIFVTGVLGNAAAWAEDGGNFYLGAGFDYSSGSYGTDTTTTMLSIPVAGMYLSGDWLFKMTVPYVLITGDGSVVPGMGGAVPGNGGGASGGGSKGSGNTTQSGLGDAVAAVSYNMYSGIEDALGMDLIGKVKFATAGAGLGTGETDYAAQVDVYRKFESFTATGSLGYQVLGDPPGSDLNNAAYGMLGGNYQFTGQTAAGTELRMSQKLYATGTGPRELVVYVSHRPDDRLRISGYLLKGLSDGSPDSGFGAMITTAL